jgi:hypothetical protein
VFRVADLRVVVLGAE